MDHITHLAARATQISSLQAQVKTERDALRRDLRTAHATGTYGKEELVRAAAGGLSRALVLEAIGDISGQVRRLLTKNGLEADVMIRRDGTVSVTSVELLDPPEEDLEPDGEPEDDPAYQRTLESSRITRHNCINGWLGDLHKAGLTASTARNGQQDTDILAGRPATVARMES